MKKNIILSFLTAIFLVALASSCKQKPHGEAYTIKMRLAPNDSFRQEMGVTMSTDMSVAGQEMGMSMDMEMNVKFDVLDDSAGLTRLKLTYEHADFSMDMKGIPSESMPENSRDAFAGVGERMTGKSLTLLLNKKNEITEVTGFDQLRDTSEANSSQDQYKSLFSKEQLNSMMGIMFQLYPGKPVQVGETWDKEIEIEMSGMKMKMNSHFKLVDVKDNVATIKLTSSYKGKGKMERAGISVQMDMDGKQDGSLSVDLKTGYLRSADHTMDIKAEAEMMGQKVPYVLKGHTTIKGK